MIPRRPKSEENVDAWLMTYADMITLLLCFFIIFVSVSEPKKDKLSRIVEGVQGKFGAVDYTNPFVGVVRALQVIIENKRLYTDVSLESNSTHLQIELASHRFFKTGGADIDEESMPLMAELIASLKHAAMSPYIIVVEAHTDDTPPQSGLYKTNWELSAARAAKITDYLITQDFPPSKLKAVALSDSRPKVPNLDAKGQPITENRLRNQRVVIRLE